MIERSELPWEMLGDHFPQVIYALIFAECRLSKCDHADECPTHQVIVCGGEACFMDPVFGEVASCPEWPCEPARKAEAGGQT